MVGAMAEALAHRGPDDEGVWLDPEAGIALGHRRLAVVDLTPGGHQPMVSADGRFVLIFNGEIYNFEEFAPRSRARGSAPSGGWRGHSDTEVLLEAIAHWGLEPALGKRRHVRACALGSSRAHADARPRPVRREAALLWLGRPRLRVRI